MVVAYYDNGTVFVVWYYEPDIVAESTPTPSPTRKPSSTQSTNNSGANKSTDTYTGSYDAVLSYGSGSVIIFASEDAMDRYMSALVNGYQGTIDEMVANGDVGYTEKNTKCNIIEEHFTKAKVKLLDGAYEGNTVWVVIEAVQKK